MMVSSTVTDFLRKSMCRGRSAMSSPQRMPVSIAVSTRSRCRSGIARDELVVLGGGQGAGLARDDLGQLGVLARVGHDELVADRTLEDGVEHGVVLADGARRQALGGGLGDPVLDQGTGDLVHQLLAEERVEVLVQVGDVGGLGGGFDVLAGEPVGLDVVVEGDRAEAGVAPGAGQDLLLLAVGGALGGPAGGVGAGGADPALGVAVAGQVAGGAVVAVAFDHVRHRGCPCHVSEMSANLAETGRRPAKVRGNPKSASDLRIYLTLAHTERAKRAS